MRLREEIQLLLFWLKTSKFIRNQFNSILSRTPLSQLDSLSLLLLVLLRWNYNLESKLLAFSMSEPNAALWRVTRRLSTPWISKSSKVTIKQDFQLMKSKQTDSPLLNQQGTVTLSTTRRITMKVLAYSHLNKVKLSTLRLVKFFHLQEKKNL